MSFATVLWSVVGALAVGILGNALWELLVRPLLQRAQRLIVGVVSIGSGALKNALYREAARMGSDTLSGHLYLFANAVLVGVTTCLVTIATGLTLLPEETRRASMPPSMGLWLSAMLVTIVGVMTISAWRTLIAHGIAASFNRRLAIIEPVLAPEERVRLRLQFAIMRSEADFLSVKKSLTDLFEDRFRSLGIDESNSAAR